MEKPDYRIEKVVGEEYQRYSSVKLDNTSYDCFLNICLCVDVDDCENYYDSDCHGDMCNKECYCVSDVMNGCDNKDCSWVSCMADGNKR